MVSVTPRRDKQGRKIKDQWRAVVRLEGHEPVQRAFRSFTEGKQWGEKLEAEMRGGTHHPVAKESRRKTLGTLIKSYLKDVTAARPGADSRKAETSRLMRFLKAEPDLCNIAATALRPSHFKDWAARRLKERVTRGLPGGRGQFNEERHKKKLRKDGQPRSNAAKEKTPKPPKNVSPSTLKRELTLLHGVIETYRDELGMEQNPVNRRQVKRPAVNDERRVRISDYQSEQLIAELWKSRNQYIAALVEFARATALRRGSLLRLKWSDVDWEENSVLLRGIKNSRSPDKIRNHTASLSTRAREILDTIPQPEDGEDGLIFPVTADALKSAFNRAREKTGIPHFRFHDQRHELPSRMGEAKLPITTIQAQTGHADIRSLSRYVHHDTRKLARILDNINDAHNAKEVARPQSRSEHRFDRKLQRMNREQAAAERMAEEEDRQLERRQENIELGIEEDNE